MHVILQGAHSKLWNIKGQVVSIHPGGCSAYIHVPEKDKTYLHNRRYIKIDRSLEYIGEEDDEQEESQITLTVQGQDREKTPKRINQPQDTMRKRRLSFSEFVLVGKRQVPVPTKQVDG